MGQQISFGSPRVELGLQFSLDVGFDFTHVDGGRGIGRQVIESTSSRVLRSLQCGGLFGLFFFLCLCSFLSLFLCNLLFILFFGLGKLLLFSHSGFVAFFGQSLWSCGLLDHFAKDSTRGSLLGHSVLLHDLMLKLGGLNFAVEANSTNECHNSETLIAGGSICHHILKN